MALAGKKPGTAPPPKKSKFQYHERTPDAVQKRATQSVGSYDSYIETRFPFFKPQQGANAVRILPGVGEWGEDHYGYDVHIHNDIGPDHATYICANKQFGEPCCLCDARRELESDGEADDANKLKPSRRVIMWVIDRAEESVGPKIWSISPTMDKDISTRSRNKRTGAVIHIDHPDDGSDVEFTREGTGLKTKYVGLEISREVTPILDDTAMVEQWLEFVASNELPNILQIYPQEYIESVFTGKAEAKDPDLEEGKDGGKPRRRLRDEAPAEEETPPAKPTKPTRRLRDEEPPPEEEAVEEAVEEEAQAEEPVEEQEEKPAPRKPGTATVSQRAQTSLARLSRPGKK